MQIQAIIDRYMRDLFYKIFENFIKVFKGLNLLWHLLAFSLTYLLVVSGTDWQYFLFWQKSSSKLWLFAPAILGFFVPIFTPVVLFIFGYVKKSAKILNTACAISQAAFLGWFLSICYKSITGRPGPSAYFGVTSITNISHIFNFGFYRGGIFFGWPSSHTTVAFAVGIALFILHSENKFIKYLSLIYAIYIGFGVSTNIHWLSDAVAGVIFGSLIGVVVGKSFKERIKIHE
jgi:membrane-associated phospholipid phosphatase